MPGERKQHSTKIANALKKYINEIEQTTHQIAHPTGSKSYLSESQMKSGKESSRGKSSSHAQRRSSASAKSKEPAHATRHSHHHASYSQVSDARTHYKSDRESYHGGSLGGHHAGSSKQAPRAQSSKHLGGTSQTSRTAGGALVDQSYSSNPLNQSKRSVATAGNPMSLENSMKAQSNYQAPASQLHGQSGIDSGYQRQPRKAASQDRMAHAQSSNNFGGHANSGFSFHNTGGSNLNQSVLTQQKRSNSTTNHRGSSAHKQQQQ